MARVRYTGGGRYRTSGVTFEPGDVHDVSPGLAEHLVTEVGDFEHVTTTDDSDDADSSDSTDGDTEEVDEPSENSASAEALDDTSYEFDEDTWFDDHEGYEAREERVRSGDVDEHLDTIDSIETSDNVRDAVGVRRAELAEE